MQELPHHYVAKASAVAGSDVIVESPGLEPLTTAGPAEFGGPGDLWSPETLLVAAIADCYILSFRAIARASKMEWLSLSCDAVGDLDKVDKVTRFTGFKLKVRLEVPAGIREGKAERLLEKADKHCLITNSMTCGSRLDYEVVVRETAG